MFAKCSLHGVNKMRTKSELNGKNREENLMLSELGNIITRNHATLAKDAAGLMALLVMLLAALNLPTLI